MRKNEIETIESVEGWVEALGYAATDDDGKQYLHPIVPVDVLVDQFDRHPSDMDVLDGVRALGFDNEMSLAVALDLIAYARKAVEHAKLLEEYIEEALANHSLGFYDSAAALFDQASSLENEYGDDPWTTAEAEEHGYVRKSSGWEWLNANYVFEVEEHMTPSDKKALMDWAALANLESVRGGGVGQTPQQMSAADEAWKALPERVRVRHKQIVAAYHRELEEARLHFREGGEDPSGMDDETLLGPDWEGWGYLGPLDRE